MLGPVRGTRLGVAIVSAVALLGCGGAEQGPRSGELSVLSYNVAGLPAGMSSSEPDKFTVLISPLLNALDLVLVQEDFAYHDELGSEAEHPYQSAPQARPVAGKLLIDGLNRFSRVPFGELERHAWEQCFGTTTDGSDCLASKGFSVATTELAPGVEVDVYNLHMDASSAEGDQDARVAQVGQLLATLTTRSQGRAVIVAGDTNLKPDTRPKDGPALERLLGEAELTDACRAVACGDERIDRIMVRSSASVRLEVKQWKVDKRFVTDAGQDLSDHEAVAIRLAWEGPLAN